MTVKPADAPVRASDSPYAVHTTAGTSYWWCACGKSAKQPFCDGSHKGTGISPIEYKATDSRTVWLCGCKATARAPMCDGTHNQPAAG